ncbi:MAG: PAS domain-containing protein, partial [Caldithrix sp.]|nr:PAS domain-containing protein [Caldithrix sp.]
MKFSSNPLIQLERAQKDLGFIRLSKKEIADYVQFHVENNLRFIRWSLLAGVLAFVLFSAFTMPELARNQGNTIIINYVISLVILSVPLLIIHNRSLHKYYDKAATLIVLIFSIFFALIARQTTPQDIPLFLAATYGLLILSYAFINMRFLYASLNGWLFQLLMNLAWLSHAQNSTEVWQFNIFMAGINIAGMFMAYALEMGYRRHYLYDRAKQHLTKKMEETIKEGQELKTKNEELTTLNNVNRRTLDEKDQRLSALEQMNEWQQLVNEWAVTFVNLQIGETDDHINHCLRAVAEFCDADRSYIYLLSRKQNSLVKTHEWYASGMLAKIEKHEKVDHTDFAWYIDKLKNNEIIYIKDTSELANEASSHKAIAEVEKTKAFINVPMHTHDKFVGLIGIDKKEPTEGWGDAEFGLLKGMGRIIMHALRRKNEYESKLKSADRLRKLFERSEDVVFILSPDSKVLDINPAGSRLLGYRNPREMNKMSLSDKSHVSAEHFQTLIDFIEKENHVREYELVLKKMDGQDVHVLITAGAV